MTGKIIYWCEQKGFGFVQDDKSHDQIFMHVSDVDYEPVTKGDEVSFEIVDSTRKPGSKQAVKIKML